ncbi:MAG: tellurite resistance TerB family protein [Rhodospirillaceae bacterium]
MINQARSILDQFLNAGSQSGGRPGGQAGGGMPDISQFLSGKGGLATGALGGGLVGLLLGGKSGRKLAGSALNMGGLALVGGLAYKAYQDWQANKEPAQPSQQVALPQPEGTAFLPDDSTAADDLSSRLVRAMVAAAKADGHVTEEERSRISAQLQALGMDADARDMIEQELATPLDINAVASLARTPEESAEVYAASLLAVDPEGSAEKGYLALLAARLKLDARLVHHLHANAEALSRAN